MTTVSPQRPSPGALHGAGDEVTVIDTEPGRESALAKAGLRAVHGDALVPSTLEAAGALRADVLVACTRTRLGATVDRSDDRV